MESFKTFHRIATCVTFTTAKGLVQCIADAMKAHQMAYERAGILHRDISVSNILMRLRYGDTSIPDRGFLIDWDHCVVLNLLPNDASPMHRIPRAGTWRFISAHLADNPHAEHTVLDDRESAFYVLAYVALRHLSNDLDTQNLIELLGVFDSYIEQRGRPDKGGARKKRTLTSLGFAEVKYKVPVLSALFRALSDVFAARYPKPVADTEDDLFFAEVLGESPPDNGVNEKLLKLLESGSWLHEILARAAARMPESENDFTDNLLRPNKKRKADTFNDSDSSTFDERISKRAKGLDGQASRVFTFDFGDSPTEL